MESVEWPDWLRRELPVLRLGDLGPGWEATERALADVQADLSATVDGAPELVILWYDDLDNGRRHAYVGTAADRYYGAGGGFEPGRHYVQALIDIAEQVQDAIGDDLLDQTWAWPLCPHHGRLLNVEVDARQICTWSCEHDGGHIVAEVGHLTGV